MEDRIIVGCEWRSLDPDVYWFGLGVESGDPPNRVVTPVELTGDSVVLVQRELNPGNWSSDLQLEVVLFPDGTGDHAKYAIRTVIPPQVANGQERTIRLVVDGVIYGPWVFRFQAP